MLRRDLVDRWRVGVGWETAQEVFRRLGDGSSLADLGLPTVDGRLDLRGLPAGGLDARDARVDGVDLSYGCLSSAHLWNVHFRDCRFDHVDASRAVFSGGSVVGSSLARADLRDAIVADAGWSSIDLSRAKTRRLTGQHSTFTEVTFGALAKVDFTGCAFVDCRFTGALNEARFLGRGRAGEHPPVVLRRVTFESSDFRYAEFDGMDFDDVTFPADDALIVVLARFRAVADRAGADSLPRRDEVGKALRRLLSEQSLRPGLSETAGWVIARRDLNDEPDLADFAATTLAAAARQLS
ncbi:pentapeptide repeat-containing protein [Asanoa siamensis]|uniref:Pentapeptide repeat-containing protein n=1 Tax=Asanoa siamensis TaxID=926357 RepID=A0ABQ4CX98_9ACTN|nr:pentapeptide repeat-containing protein [Asanoa siamensis]GIF75917.1 hypothetical protein Asi02nite_54350 [Asanoa siamensis]